MDEWYVCNPLAHLATDFAFMHELNFLKFMISRISLDTRDNIEPLYPSIVL